MHSIHTNFTENSLHSCIFFFTNYLWLGYLLKISTITLVPLYLWPLAVSISLQSFPERGHPLNTDQKFAENLIFLTPWYANVGVRIRKVKNVSFSEIFAYAFASHPTLQHLCLLVCSRPIDAFHNRIYSHLRVGIQILHQKHS